MVIAKFTLPAVDQPHPRRTVGMPQPDHLAADDVNPGEGPAQGNDDVARLDVAGGDFRQQRLVCHVGQGIGQGQLRLARPQALLQAYGRVQADMAAPTIRMRAVAAPVIAVPSAGCRRTRAVPRSRRSGCRPAHPSRDPRPQARPASVRSAAGFVGANAAKCQAEIGDHVQRRRAGDARDQPPGHGTHELQLPA
jgi:hypothetical protein